MQRSTQASTSGLSRCLTTTCTSSSCVYVLGGADTQVLSIFFPLRGISYTSASEREELLQSSRVVLKIESSGFEVWSSWDLVVRCMSLP